MVPLNIEFILALTAHLHTGIIIAIPVPFFHSKRAKKLFKTINQDTNPKVIITTFLSGRDEFKSTLSEQYFPSLITGNELKYNDNFNFFLPCNNIVLIGFLLTLLLIGYKCNFIVQKNFISDSIIWLQGINCYKVEIYFNHFCCFGKHQPQNSNFSQVIIKMGVNVFWHESPSVLELINFESHRQLYLKLTPKQYLYENSVNQLLLLETTVLRFSNMFSLEEKAGSKLL
ncbi:hypothetical protein QPK13_10400 [Photorhabdus tasmaniensis]